MVSERGRQKELLFEKWSIDGKQGYALYKWWLGRIGEVHGYLQAHPYARKSGCHLRHRLVQFQRIQIYIGIFGGKGDRYDYITI